MIYCNKFAAFKITSLENYKTDGAHEYELRLFVKSQTMELLIKVVCGNKICLRGDTLPVRRMSKRG